MIYAEYDTDEATVEQNKQQNHWQLICRYAVIMKVYSWKKVNKIVFRSVLHEVENTGYCF